VKKRIFAGPDASFPSLGVASMHRIFESMLAALDSRGARVRTTSGRVHGDMHGGNLLLDVAGNVWMIDFADVGPGHSLTDLAKLFVACVATYMPIDDDSAGECAGFEELCRTLAAARTGLALPRAPELPPRLRRLEDILATLWPCFAGMDPHGAAEDSGPTSAIALAIMRYAVRFASCERGPTRSNEALRRCAYLGTACAQRILHDAGASSCAWLAAARARWTRAVAQAPSLDPDAPRRAYLASACADEAWIVNPVSFEKAPIEEVCVKVRTEHLPAELAAELPARESPRESRRRSSLPSSRRASRRSSLPSADLSAGLEDLFPDGLPSRLLIIGTGGTGKTTLTKQVLVAAARHALTEGRGVVPFRLALQDVGRELARSGGWDVVVQCLSRARGPASAAVAACRSAAPRDVLLLLDGLDEAHEHRERIVGWLGTIDAHVVVTSRPSALGGFGERLGELGFCARRVLSLEPDAVRGLAGKFAQRVGLGDAAAAALADAVLRPAYRSLATVPSTLNLLLHVVHRDGVDATLARPRLYSRAVTMIVQSDLFRLRLHTGETSVAWTLDTVRCVAFGMHLRGARSLPWAAFGELGGELRALEEHVRAGFLPLLEVVHGDVQFAHLSYQEYLAAEAVALIWRCRQCRDRDHLAPGVRDRSYSSEMVPVSAA